jgi:hypothetical protein
MFSGTALAFSLAVLEIKRILNIICLKLVDCYSVCFLALRLNPFVSVTGKCALMMFHLGDRRTFRYNITYMKLVDCADTERIDSWLTQRANSCCSRLSQLH